LEGNRKRGKGRAGRKNRPRVAKRTGLPVQIKGKLSSTQEEKRGNANENGRKGRRGTGRVRKTKGG